MSATGGKRSLVAGGLVTVLTGSLLVLGAGTAHADSRFTLIAQGDAMYYEVNYAGAPASPNNEAGSLTARSDVNSQGNSTSFAGAPYFGPTVTTVPGTGNGIISPYGVQVPVSSVPGYVDSRYPSQPKKQDDQPSYRVLATSEADGGSASADNGAPPGTPSPNQQQKATSMVKANADGSVIAKALASVQGVSTGPVTGFDGTTVATITQTAGGAPKIVAKASGKFEIAGMGVSFDEKGFTVAGQGVPAGSGLDMLNSVLASANTKLEAVPTQTTRDPVSGITTYTIGGMRMTTTQTNPQDGSVFKLSTIFARVQVASVNVPLEDDVVTTPVVSSPTDSGAVAPPATGSGGGTANPPALGPVSSGEMPATGTIPPPQVTLGDPGSTPATTTGGGNPSPPTKVLGAVRSAAPQGSDNQLLYLVLALAGLGVIGGQQLFSRFGIQLLLRTA